MTILNHHQASDDEASPGKAASSISFGNPATITSCTERARVAVPLARYEATCEFITFNGLIDRCEHLCLAFGDWKECPAPLVRIHSECMTGDIFGSLRCDCGPQLDEALQLLSRQGGLLLYMRQEGRGIGLYNKMDTYSLQLGGLDTFEANAALGFAADERDYSPAVQMLRCLSISAVTLLTNNVDKADQLRQNGIDVISLLATGHFANPHNAAYLRAKSDCSQHVQSA